MEPSAPSAPAGGRRLLGRFDVRSLLGKSRATMAWLAIDLQARHEVMLVLPRHAPADEVALQEWLGRARLGARLRHPNLAPVVDIGVDDSWPYIAIERSSGITLGEWLGSQAPPPADSAAWMAGLLEGLAYVHEAGQSHGDLQAHLLLIDERGVIRLAGVGAGGGNLAAGSAELDNERAMAVDPARLRGQRDAAGRDLLAAGLLLHRLLAGVAPFDEPDLARASERLAPVGREALRLPWSTPQPVPEALRAIANRATDRQPRQRYLSARGMLRALRGWIEASTADDGGALALLLDRLRTVGHLPGRPGVVERVARLALDDQQRTQEIAQHILEDVALSLELLRQVNTAEVRGSQVSGNGPVLTLRRAVALVGLTGVRKAALALRAWPGPLDEQGALALARQLDAVRLAGYTAQGLRPAGYDGDVVYLLATLQNLGRLLLQYHFPSEMTQIRQLMRPAPAPEEDGRIEPGLGERDATFAVLGIDVETIAPAVARHWGLTEEVAHMIRRLPTERPVFNPDGDADLIRAAASAGNEAVDALLGGDAKRVPRDLQRVAQRYARALGLKPGDLQAALEAARAKLRGSRMEEDAARPRTAAPRQSGPAAAPVAAAAQPGAAPAASSAPAASAPSALRQRAQSMTSLTPGTESTVRAASFPT